MQIQGRLPAIVVADVAERDRDGELIAKPVEWDEDGPPPRILVRRSRVKRDNAPAPGLGARVLMRVEFNPQRPARSRPIPDGSSRSSRSSRRASFAVFRKAEDGSGPGAAGREAVGAREFHVPAAFAGEAEDGDLVAIEPMRAPRLGVPSARVVESLGSVKSESAVSLIALAQHHIPFVFSPAALKEAEAARPVRLEGSREDWRSLPLVTIDPPDAKDHDDAVHAAPDPDPGNPGGLIVTVAIADVAAYVRPGSALDRDALERGNSVYFPDRVVPMLPERISNDLCSLKAARGPPGAGGADDPRRGRAQAVAPLPPHHDALGRQAVLRAGAGGDRRPAGRDDRAAARNRARAALRRLRRGQDSSASGAIRSISTCPSGSSSSTRTGGSPACAGRNGSTRTG